MNIRAALSVVVLGAMVTPVDVGGFWCLRTDSGTGVVGDTPE